MPPSVLDDSCPVEKGNCVFTPNSAPCDDSNDCTANDVCVDSVCIGSGEVVCDDFNECTTE